MLQVLLDSPCDHSPIVLDVPAPKKTRDDRKTVAIYELETELIEMLRDAWKSGTPGELTGSIIKASVAAPVVAIGKASLAVSNVASRAFMKMVERR